MNKDRFSLTEEDIKEGIENFFIQLLIEAKIKKPEINNIYDISSKNPKISYIRTKQRKTRGNLKIQRYLVINSINKYLHDLLILALCCFPRQ